MKRIRLTASAIAASSLGSLGLAGLGAPVAQAAVTPKTAFNGLGFDTCAAPSDATMDDWYAHSPYRGVGVYIGGSSYLCGSAAAPSGGYTAQWVQHQAATGWGMWAIYSGKQGKDLIALPAGSTPDSVGALDGADAAAQAAALGFAPGTTIFVDIEGYDQDATSQAVVAYLKSLGNAVTAKGYKLGLYGNSKNHAQFHSAIGDAVADPALAALISAVDISGTTADQPNFRATTNDPWVPAGMWARHQRIHQYINNVQNPRYGSSTIPSIDEDYVDLAPSTHLATDPTQRAVRWAGSDRIGTAVAVSQQLWPTTTGNANDYYGPNDRRPLAKAAVLSRSDDFPDALGGSALAAHEGGPLLLSATAGLSQAAEYELKRTLAPGSTVYLLGGEKALSAAVFNRVAALGFTPVRLWGADRYTTSVRVAQEMQKDMKDSTGAPSVQRVMLATAGNFADALAAGTAVGATPDSVLLLTNGTQMPAATSAYVGQLSGAATGPNSAFVYPVGGAANTAAKSLTIPAGNLKLDGLVGADRYQTAALVARQFFGSTGTPHEYGITTGLGWADALSGGAAMATLDGPLLLTAPGSLSPATSGFLAGEAGGGSIDMGIVFGGPVAVSDGVLNAL